MLTDIWTVTRKELIEIIHMRGNKRSGWLNVLLVVGLLGIFMPMMNGREWVTDAVDPISFAWLPLFLVVSVVADAFAGERERHTLETLLASRLPDRAILLGKMGAAVIYCAGISLASLLIGGVTANLSAPGEPFVFYPAALLAGLVVFSLLLAVVMAAVGVLVSLRAATVREAYQKLSLSVLALWMVLIVGLRFAPEEIRESAMAYFNEANLPLFIGALFAVLVVAGVILTWAAMGRFQRSKLIVD